MISIFSFGVEAQTGPD